ncbi:MAG: hypothetical protein R3310_13235, partial [Candidatus Competibacteraceae bacterium]|nr:hypothetical protein [Candidatus Competibacteraceae bacterium]
EEIDRARKLLDHPAAEERCIAESNEVKRLLQRLATLDHFSFRERLYFALGALGVVAAVVVSFTAGMAPAVVVFCLAVVIALLGLVHRLLRIRLALHTLRVADDRLGRCLGGR